jgi:hypothetical protein
MSDQIRSREIAMLESAQEQLGALEPMISFVYRQEAPQRQSAGSEREEKYQDRRRQSPVTRQLEVLHKKRRFSPDRLKCPWKPS